MKDLLYDKSHFIFINKLSFHAGNIVKLQQAASIKMFYIKNKIINNNVIVIINNKGYNILNNYTKSSKGWV